MIQVHHLNNSRSHRILWLLQFGGCGHGYGVALISDELVLEAEFRGSDHPQHQHAMGRERETSIIRQWQGGFSACRSQPPREPLAAGGNRHDRSEEGQSPVPCTNW